MSQALSSVSQAGSIDQARESRVPESVPVSIVDVDVSIRETRILTGIEPLDRVLGGGVVVGSVIILSGEPGAGKSTLLMQMVASVSCDGPRLYATGEESVPQVAMRANRVGAMRPDIQLVRETDVDAILWHAIDQRARVVVVDSIQTISSSISNGAIGSDHQVKVCGQILQSFAKSTGIAVIMISHINKDGDISGPKNFEHLGDVTLMLENCKELGEPWRLLRSFKNRFGSTQETGMFQMAGDGLIPIGKTDEPERKQDKRPSDELLPIAQELIYKILELGGEVDAGLRDRIAGRLDLIPRSTS